MYYRDLGKHVWYPYRDFAVRVIARTLCFGALCKEGLLWRLSSKEEHVAYQWLAQAYYQEERPFEDTMEEAHGSGAGTASGGGLEKHASGNPEDLGHFVAYRSQEGIGKAPHGTLKHEPVRRWSSEESRSSTGANSNIPDLKVGIRHASS